MSTLSPFLFFTPIYHNPLWGNIVHFYQVCALWVFRQGIFWKKYPDKFVFNIKSKMFNFDSVSISMNKCIVEFKIKLLKTLREHSGKDDFDDDLCLLVFDIL